MPITWQNINAPSNADVMRGFAQAGQGITAGFDKLGEVITQREAVNQGAADRLDDGNVLALKEALAGARTPEEVAALTSQLNTMRAGLTTKGRTAVLGAEDARVSALQQQIQARNAFEDGLGRRTQTNALNAVNDPVALATAQAVAARAPTEQTLVDKALAQRVALQPITDETARVVARTASGDAAATELNAPVTRDLARKALLNRQVVEPITQATAVTTARNAGAAADFTARRAPGLEALTLKEDSIKGKTLSVQEQQTVDTLEDQNITNQTATLAAAYQQSNLKDKMALGALATKMKLPVDAIGAPDLARISTIDLEKLNVQAAAAGLRPTTMLMAGDTKAAADMTRSLVESGKFTPAGIARNAAKITSAFNTAGQGVPIGNDALAAAVKQAGIDTAQEQSDQNNWYAPGTGNALKSYEKLNSMIEPLFKGTDMAEDLPDIQNFLHKMATTGLEVKKGVFLVPSEQDMMAAVRSKMGKWNWFNNSRAGQIEDFLKEKLDTPRVTELVKQAEASKGVNEARSIREKVKEALYPKK